MLKYPKPGQAKGLIKLAKQCNIDFVLHYYPLLLTGHTLTDAYEMLYELYKKELEEYKTKNIYFLRGSSGGNLALELITHINAKGETLPMPGKYDVNVTLEVGEGMYHSYATMPLVK